MSKVKRKLTKISFDFDKAHLAYTSTDYPACSMLDDPILLKSLEEGKELTLAQRMTLEAAGHDVSEVGKSTEGVTKSSTSINEGIEVDNLNENEEGSIDTMSQELLKAAEERIEALEKQAKAAEAKADLIKYNLDAELTKSVAEQLAQVEDASVVFKALDALVADKEEALTKAKEEAAETLEKAKATKVDAEGNPLAEMLEKEVGESGEAEQEVTKSKSAMDYLIPAESK